MYPYYVSTLTLSSICYVSTLTLSSVCYVFHGETNEPILLKFGRDASWNIEKDMNYFYLSILQSGKIKVERL